MHFIGSHYSPASMQCYESQQLFCVRSQQYFGILREDAELQTNASIKSAVPCNIWTCLSVSGGQLEQSKKGWHMAGTQSRGLRMNHGAFPPVSNRETWCMRVNISVSVRLAHMSQSDVCLSMHLPLVTRLFHTVSSYCIPYACVYSLDPSQRFEEASWFKTPAVYLMCIYRSTLE